MSDDLVSIRASSTPSARVCPGSIRTTDLKIRSHNEESALGSAAHEVMAAWVGADVALPLHEVARRWCLESEGELERLVRFGKRAWETLKPTYGPARTEVSAMSILRPGIAARLPDVLYPGVAPTIVRPPAILTGHMDTQRVVEEIKWAGVLDWKSGRVDRSHFDQFMSYALLTFDANPEIETVDVAGVWLRDQTIEPYRITRAEAEAWRAKIVSDIVDWDGTYYTGEHCGHCQRSHDCPALVASARRDIAILSDPEMVQRIEVEASMATLSDAQIVALHRRAKGLESFLKTFHDVKRAEARRRGGSIDAGDGFELRFLPSKRREVDTLKAWPVLHQRMTDEEIAEVCEVHVSRAEAVVKRNAPNRGGAAAIRELAGALEAAGAVTTVEEESLRLVRKKEG